MSKRALAYDGGSLYALAAPRTVSTDVTIADTDTVVRVDTTAANRVATLPAAGTCNGPITVKNIGTHTLTIDPNGSLIDGAANLVLRYRNSSVTVYSDATNWNVA